jgi:hypothetical protein
MSVELATDRSALAAIASPVGQVAFVMEAGRQGLFQFRTGDLSQQVAADPLQGLFVASALVPATTGAWARVWDTINGQPEWFGAQAGDAQFDNRAALGACVALCPVTQLAEADYWVGGRWTVSTPHRTICGVGRNFDSATPGTRVLLASATEDVFMLGTDAQPPSINDFVAFVDIRNITFMATVDPVPPPLAPLRQGGQACVRGQFIVNCSFARVYAINGTNGFYMTGAVYSEIGECAAQRLAPAARVPNDYYIGCMLDGTPNIGACTGIASMYIRKIVVTGGGNGVSNYGLYSLNGFTDMFIDSVETTAVQFGITLNGNPSSTIAYGSEDCKVSACVLDQVQRGISFTGGNNRTAAVAMNNYIATAPSPPGSIAIAIDSTPLAQLGGTISLIGNQMIGIGGGSTGIGISNSSGVESSGNIMTDLNNPIAISNGSQIRLADRISNPVQTADTAAVSLTGCTRVVIDCSADGKAGAFPVGIDLVGTGNTLVEARLTGMNAASITGGSANVLVDNAVPVGVVGPFGNTCLAQGIIG